MKARFIAALLSFVVVTLPAQAEIAVKKTEVPIVITTDKIDLNRADAGELTGSFKGIGRKRAEAIVAYRETHHGFKAIEELAEVKGFGQRFVEKNRDKLNKVFVVK